MIKYPLVARIEGDSLYLTVALSKGERGEKGALKDVRRVSSMLKKKGVKFTSYSRSTSRGDLPDTLEIPLWW